MTTGAIVARALSMAGEHAGGEPWGVQETSLWHAVARRSKQVQLSPRDEVILMDALEDGGLEDWDMPFDVDIDDQWCEQRPTKRQAESPLGEAGDQMAELRQVVHATQAENQLLRGQLQDLIQ
eukprot:2803222-Amphidinium_carterae.2